MTREQLEKDTQIHELEPRVGGSRMKFRDVIRAYHVPTGILVDVPRGNRTKDHDRQAALDMIECALASGLWGQGEKP